MSKYLIRRLSRNKARITEPTRKGSLYIASFILVITVSLVTGWSGNKSEGVLNGWDPLIWDKGAAGVGDRDKGLFLKIERILDVFQRAGPLNPPVGLRVSPRCELLDKPVSSGKAPAPVVLHLPMKFPSGSLFSTGGVRVWINEPLNLLGEPVWTDDQGGIFLLPPVIEAGGQRVYTRSAHPPGYAEVFPSRHEFPLWGNNLEPFLRAVIRPAFGLYEPTVTTVITSGNENFWKPVSQERWIMAMITRAEEILDNFQSGVNAASASNITRQQIEQMQKYLRQIRDAFDEKAVIERHYEMLDQARQLHTMMLSINPAEAEKYYIKAIEGSDQRLQEALAGAAEQRPVLEKYERDLLQALVTREDIWTEADASIKGGNWDRLEEIGKELGIDHLVFIADAGRAKVKLKVELNSLSPAERHSPAYGFEIPEWHPLGPYKHVVAMDFKAIRPSGLVPAGTKGARAIVCIDEEFFSRQDDDASIRLIAVEWWEEVDARYRSEGGMFYNERRVTMLDDLWKSLDWSSLRAIID
jgi:hypothetical protein